MSDPARVPEYDENSHYTYADYLGWEGPERYQLLDGKVFFIAPPSVIHQALLMELSIQFGKWLEEKPCRVFFAPLDVRLFPKSDNSDDTVVQPDLMVVCDDKKLNKDSVNGAPDLVLEIVSPSDTYSELFLKFLFYLEAGVREYWVIDPEAKRILVHIYENGHYISSVHKGDGSVPVTILPGLNIALKNLWEAAL